MLGMSVPIPAVRATVGSLEWAAIGRGYARMRLTGRWFVCRVAYGRAFRGSTDGYGADSSHSLGSESATPTGYEEGADPPREPAPTVCRIG